MATMSSAQLLIDFFEAEQSQKSLYEMFTLLSAVADVDAHVDLWEKLGQDVKAFRASRPAWIEEIYHHVDPTRGVLVGYGRSNSAAGLQQGDLGVLRWVAQKMSEASASLNEEQRETVRKMVANARSVVLEDDSLPDRLRMHLIRLMAHVEDVLDTYAVTGDFSLEDAVERLLGAIRVAEASTERPDLWTTLRDDWLQPVGVALLANAPATALGLAALTRGA